MKSLLLAIALVLLLSKTYALPTEPVQKKPSWGQQMSKRWHQIWYEGTTDLILSGYAWHNRYTYSPEKIKTYNELAAGGGLAKDYFDERGNEHAFYAIAFLDSHKNVEPALGYAYILTAHLNNKASLGLGYTLLVTMRPDINHNIPFPGILPWATANYGRASLMATYIPGARGAGNVLLILGKIILDN